MKLYVGFIYFRPRKEVNLGFSTVNKYSEFAAVLYYSSFFVLVFQKKEYLGKMI